MLLGMQQAAQTVAPSIPGGFAGILAGLSGPALKNVPAWNDEGLQEDVATLTYERALRTHARYRPADGEDHPSALPPHSLAPPALAAEAACSREVIQPGADDETQAALPARKAVEWNRKRASVTVRLSEDESAQLRKRAGEAGLTVSAYLRSCTFEVDALRAQVKEALAELRAAGSKPIEAALKPVRQTLSRRILRSFLFWHRNEHTAEA